MTATPERPRDWAARWPYEGPTAKLALIGGSPTWGLDKRAGRGFATIAGEEGVVHEGTWRLRTPYGVGPLLERYRMPDGRAFIRIPSYGQIQNEFPDRYVVERRVGWILWKAGVEAVLIGGTSGTVRDDVRPGDFVVVADFTDPCNEMAIGLPGTEWEESRPRLLPRLRKPFCTEIGAILEEEARRRMGLWPAVHGQDAGVILCREHGPTFDTAAAVLAYKRSGMAHLIGDCYLPRLARQLGMHLGYYHLPANWCEGYAPEHSLEGTLDPLYLNRAEPCARFELAVMRRLEVPTSCECMALRVVRPAAYMDELSPPASLAPGVNAAFDPPDERAPGPRASGGHAS